MDSLGRLNMLLDTVESIDEERAQRLATVALGLISDDHPSTVDVAAGYLSWALAKPTIADGDVTFSCRCSDGWLDGVDGGIKPCPRCRPASNEKWFSEFANSGMEPR